MTVKFKLVFLLLMGSSLIYNDCLYGQSGGRSIFTFMNLPSSARTLALGGYQPSLSDSDINLLYENPASGNPSLHHALSFNHSFYFDKVQFGYATYGYHLEKSGITLGLGVRYIDYGTFNQTNELGDITGEFDASETAVGITASKSIYERLSLGVAARFAQASFETYMSNAILFDIGALYEIPEQKIFISLVLKNFGFQMSRFWQEREPLPFDIRAGISKRLEHLPFRFSITAHNLHRWNINYDDPSASSGSFVFGSEQEEEDPRFNAADNFFRHLIFSGEFYLGPNEQFQLRLAYNHLLGREMSLPDARVFSGLSFGLGFRVNRFRLEYGFGRYHTGANANKITISTQLSEFKSNIL